MNTGNAGGDVVVLGAAPVESVGGGGRMVGRSMDGAARLPSSRTVRHRAVSRWNVAVTMRTPRFESRASIGSAAASSVG